MDLTKETINRILELAPATVIEIDGRKYSDKNISPLLPPQAGTIKLHSLDGLVLFHQTSSIENVQIIVESPTSVKLLGGIEDPWKLRSCYVSAECYQFDFMFGKFYPQEEFVIKLMTQFADVGQRGETLKLVGNVSLEHGTKLQDDGFSQTVAVKKGARFENETVLNPSLAPLRTFIEIDPPLSKFVLRHKEGSFALFDSEGEWWKMEKENSDLKEKLWRAEQALELLDAVAPGKVALAKEIAAGFEYQSTMGQEMLDLANGIDKMREQSKYAIIDGWRLPTKPAENCPKCKEPILPAALDTGDGWYLHWCCENGCCPYPDTKMEIDWPFVAPTATAKALEAIGFTTSC